LNIYIPSINRTVTGVKSVTFERGMLLADGALAGRFNAFRVSSIARLAVDITEYRDVDHTDYLHSILAIHLEGSPEPIYVARPAFCAFYSQEGLGEGA